MALPSHLAKPSPFPSFPLRSRWSYITSDRGRRIESHRLPEWKLPPSGCVSVSRVGRVGADDRRRRITCRTATQAINAGSVAP